jgi:hypothetical protein
VIFYEITGFLRGGFLPITRFICIFYYRKNLFDPNISTRSLSEIWLDPNGYDVVSAYIRFINSFII